MDLLLFLINFITNMSKTLWRIGDMTHNISYILYFNQFRLKFVRSFGMNLKMLPIFIFYSIMNKIYVNIYYEFGMINILLHIYYFIINFILNMWERGLRWIWDSMYCCMNVWTNLGFYYKFAHILFFNQLRTMWSIKMNFGQYI